MADMISPRAKAILEEIEREAGGHREPSRAEPGRAPAPAARLNLPEPPSARLGRPASAPISPPPAAPEPFPAPGGHRFENSELSRLVDDVVAQTEQARLRLSALSEAIEDIAGRLGLRLEATSPALPLEPSGGDVAVLPRRTSDAPAAPLVAGDRASDAVVPARVGPGVPLDEQLRVLDTLLTQRRAAPPEPAGDGPRGQGDTSRTTQAMGVDGGRSVPAGHAVPAPYVSESTLPPKPGARPFDAVPPPPARTGGPVTDVRARDQGPAPTSGRFEEPPPAHTPTPPPPVVYDELDVTGRDPEAPDPR